MCLMSSKWPMSRVPGTRKLREIRDSAIVAAQPYVPKGHCISHSLTLHFFEDCILAFYETSSNMHDIKKTAVYTKESIFREGGINWGLYTDQFEPAEGKHSAVKYSPTESTFPTETW